MKILQISPRKPFPPIGGGEIVTYHTIKGLADLGHDVTLVSIVDKKEEIPESQEICTWRPVEKDTSTTLRGVLTNLMSRKPYTPSKYHSSRIEEKIRDVVNGDDFDLVHLDGLHVAYYGVKIKKEFDLPIILREHNVESEIMQRFYQNQRNPFLKAYAYLQYKKLYEYEAAASETFDRCLMITDRDAERLQNMNTNAEVGVVPAGVDVDYFSPRKVVEEPNSIVFVGSMDWPPNADGLSWFSREIFPLIKEEVPGIKLYVVGRNPPRRVQRLEGQSVEVTGFVDDVRDYMATAEVFIVPLRIGSGMRIKILNAMAMGKPVVSTKIGSEGIAAEDGKNIYLANSPLEFARTVIKLLHDEKERKRIGRRGRALVEGRYSWEMITRQLEECYNKIVRG